MSRVQNWMTVAALLALGMVSGVIWHLMRAAPQKTAALPPPATIAAPAPASAPVIATPPAPTAGPTAPARTEELVGKASGTLRFALPATGNGPDVVVELKPQASVGVWLPGEKRLRIVLLDHLPDFVEATRAVDAIASNAGAGQSGQKRAVVELAFIPTAQAYTPEEVESIRLVITDDAGRSASADITSSVQWSGGLAAPEVSTAATQLQLQSTGNRVSSDTAARAQSWDFSTALPVAMRQ